MHTSGLNEVYSWPVVKVHDIYREYDIVLYRFQGGNYALQVKFRWLLH